MSEAERDFLYSYKKKSKKNVICDVALDDVVPDVCSFGLLQHRTYAIMGFGLMVRRTCGPSDL